MSPAVDISELRGFALDEDYPGNTAILLVKLPIEEFAERVGALEGVSISESALGEEGDPYSSPVFQLRGHSWTVIFSGGPHDDKFAARVSSELAVPTFSWFYGDTADWEDLIYFENGEIIEHYAAGCDYDDEMAEYAEERGEDPPEDTDGGVPWDTVAHDDDDKYVFRSSVRSATEEEISSRKAFKDKLLTERDACIPDWDYLANPSKMSELPEHFVAVYDLK